MSGTECAREMANGLRVFGKQVDKVSHQDTIIRGVLESADEEMNLVMREVALTPLQGDKQELDWIYIKGHHIRLPPHTHSDLCNVFLPGIFSFLHEIAALCMLLPQSATDREG